MEWNEIVTKSNTAGPDQLIYVLFAPICRKTRRVLEQAEIIREKPKGFVSYDVGLSFD